MRKLLYIAALFVLGCEDPAPTKITKMVPHQTSIGQLDDYSNLVTVHDDERKTTCYVVLPKYNCGGDCSRSISCVKDEVVTQK